ncbi:MAG: dephospho-CoA kinase [bacterium]
MCLTGGIAGGKSSAAEMFADLGARVVSTDEVAREIMRTGDVQRDLTEALGRSFFTPEGELKNSELAAYIFHHPDAMQKVNALIHPRVYEEVERRWREVEDRPGCFFVETALAVETGYVERFDVVVVVTAPRTERLRRLVEEKGLTADQAVARMAAQLPEEEKVERADHVIENDGTLEDLEERVRALYERLCTDE